VIRTALNLDAIADALDAHGIPYTARGNHARAECPACHTTGHRKRRRPVVFTQQPGRVATYAHCGCQITDIAAALDLPPAALLSFAKTNVPSTTRNAGRKGNDAERLTDRNANAWGVSLAVDKLGRGPGQRNLKSILKVAGDIDTQSMRLKPGEWLSYASGRAARELAMDRKSVRRALDWLVTHNIIDERQLPAPGDKVVTERGRLTAKSGVKQYRLLTERQQIERLSRRG